VTSPRVADPGEAGPEADGRVAVVTGGAGAIGGSIAAALAGAGHTVLVLDQDGDPPVDLSDEHQVRAAAGRVHDQHGRCDVLVHAAAAFDRADLAAVDLATWRRVQAVNVESALLLAQAFVPGMATRGFGRIIFVVSDTIWSPPSTTCGTARRCRAPWCPRTWPPPCFLASDGAAALTGQTLCVDGGLVLR
jgi:NAD(P)-dependent dehydrogenase (short-subunit alcohol dehydrogenase family)